MRKSPALSWQKWQSLFSITIFLICCLVISFFGIRQLTVSQASAKISFRQLFAIPIRPHRAICGFGKLGFARCNAHVATDTNQVPMASSTPLASSYGPVQFHTAYNLPCSPGETLEHSVCNMPNGFGPQTIAIVDAYKAPNIENDLGVYDTLYGLPTCTVANGCLQIVNQSGGSSLPTTVDAGWALETSLDVEVAHAICQTCKVLLVETNSNSISSLGSGVDAAVNLGATAVSNSYGGSEWSGETSDNSYYDHPGVAITASSGDNGYGSEFPAADPSVTSVGGTTLQIFTDNTYSGETAWSGSGSGCSAFENAAVWQTDLPNWGQTGCNSKRAIADVSADADPNTGAAVYDSTPYSGQSGWWQVGGTSLASPIIAGVYALTGSLTPNTSPVSYPYSSFNLTDSHDIISGSNGNCSTNMCQSGQLFDGPTGLGTPNGVNGFLFNSSATPSPTLTPTFTPTPTIDNIAPLVSITSPLNGALVQHSTRVTITANASDNIGVSKVEFYINGVLKSTNKTSPYRYSWLVPSKRNVVYSITAKAYDAVGNNASDTITVTSK